MKIPFPSDRLLRCAVSAARAAGKHAAANEARRKQVFRRFKHDVKLRLDIECQEVAEGVIRRAFSSHAILGEEGSVGGVMAVDGDFVWIVDPIDGTVNFTHGLRYWCCSVAVMWQGRVVAGAVYAPVLGELYTACVSGAALLNGRKIRVSSERRLDRAMVMTGMDKQATVSDEPLSLLRRIALRVQKVRVAGSAALDVCQVACGRADGYFETGIYLWDVAAAGLILERAGGRGEQLARPDERHRLAYMGSNGRIHVALKRTIGPCRLERGEAW